MATIILQSAGQIDPAGSKVISVQYQTYATPSNDATLYSVFGAAQSNTITLPTNPAPTGCVIIPPSANTQSLLLKGVAGDTGVSISQSLPTKLTFNSVPPVSFVLTSGAAIAGAVIVSFF